MPRDGLEPRLEPGWKRLFAGIALIAITLLAYLPAMRAGFVWDDDLLVTNNPVALSPGGLHLIWSGSAAPDYAPLTYSSFWIEWRLWANDAAGYHLVSILLHAASVLLIWRILVRLSIPGAWLGALLFAIHPVNVASVAWIAERKNTLSLFFYLLSILWYLDFANKGRQSWYALALVAAGCAFLSKGSTVVLPVVLLGCVWWRTNKITLDDWLETAPFFALAAWVALQTVRYQVRLAPPVSAHASIAFRLVRAGDAFWFYLWKDFIPVQLCAIYPQWPIRTHAILPYLPALLAGACLLVFWLNRKGWGRNLLFACGYFVVALLPVLGFVNMTFMDQAYVADWWQHIAIIGMAALVAAAIARTWRAAAFRGKTITALLTCGILFFLAMRTWSEAAGYESMETHCRRTLALNPNAWTALANLGNVLQNEGRVPEAIPLYEAAVRLKPDDPKAQLDFGLALQSAGKADEAFAHYQVAARIDPNDPDVLLALGNAFRTQDRSLEAIAQYEKALALRPNDPTAENNFGNVLIQAGRVDEAISHYRKALSLAPEDGIARRNLDRALHRLR